MPLLVFCSQRRQKCYSCGKCKPGRRWRQGGGRKYIKCRELGRVNILFPLPMLLKSWILRPTDKAERELFISTRKARTYFWRPFNFKWGALLQWKEPYLSYLKYRQKQNGGSLDFGVAGYPCWPAVGGAHTPAEACGGCFAAISTVDGCKSCFMVLSRPECIKILFSVLYCLSSQIMLKSLN